MNVLNPRSLRFARRWGALAAAAAALASCGLAPLRADLVWTPEGGWEVKGGVLAPFLSGTEAASALEAMNKAKANQEAGNYWTAINNYDDVIDNYPSSVFAPEALYQKGLIYTERHQFAKAYDAYNRIITRYPDYPRFNEVIGREFKLGNLVQDGERPYLWGVIPWFKDITKANDFYEGVVKNAPYSEYAPMSLMKIAQVAISQTSFLDKDQPEVAIDALDRLINNYPQSMLAPHAYMELSNVYSSLVIGPAYDQGSTRQAIRYLRDYLFLYRDDPGAADAQAKLNEMMDTYARSQLILGDFYYNYRNNNRAALLFYNQAITIAHDSPAAEEARGQIEKIQQRVAPPMTPYDWVFGRYKEPSLLAYDEQGRIDNLANVAFGVNESEDFMEMPGSEAVETISGNGTVQQYEGITAPSPLGPVAPLPPAPEPGFLTPAEPPPVVNPGAGEPQPDTGRPLIR